jgi:hypothetical protein
MKNPTASFGTIGTIWKLLMALFMYPFQDDEANYYQNGVYKDELKAQVYATQLSPVANQWQKLTRIDKQNHYYALFRPI